MQIIRLFFVVVVLNLKIGNIPVILIFPIWHSTDLLGSQLSGMAVLYF